MNWIQSILPNCCSSRSSVQAKDLNKSVIQTSLPEIVVIPAKDYHSDTQSEHTSDIKTKDFDVEERKDSGLLGADLKKNDIIESRRSTSCTLTALDSAMLTLSTFCCEFCGKDAEGYCPGCPNKRFCQKCYLKMHTLIGDDLHIFVGYASVGKKISNRQLSSIIKIKSLI
ncbi:hypothetical protein SteCoe_23939 [Stentor coeruleus]|uniref:Uncharacterized protein n=1 Tax=Stentor coeruleus TaxID=5963 RepID=A0A1R2BIM6_9CILI|nr:hypothetical protein SteCoe_23939 [Stentor coeruleus]